VYVPPPGSITLQLSIGDDVIEFSRPSAMDFPLADYSYLPLFHALDLSNIVTLLCLMLTEAKILLQTKHYGMDGMGATEPFQTSRWPHHMSRGV
jgi:hypothetical protein